MKNLICLCIVYLLCGNVIAQHDHHHQTDSVVQKNMGDTMPAKKQPMESMPDMHHTMQEHSMHTMPMNHAFSRNLPMTRNGSGTSWLPDNSPMYGYMFHQGNWMYMLHGAAFLRYNKQDLLDRGSRGDAKFDVPNMVMFMGQRPVGEKGLFHFNVMASLDPFSVGLDGYPLLFQSGESYKGQPLVDRQHPHDLIGELSVSYSHSFNPKTDLYVYAGYPGEPALGPTAFLHRPSGMLNPDAPLSHHWSDATHITFGVATVGLRYGHVKLEASSFTGREPDEDRYNFDKPRFDSYSGRISYNPSARWSFQASHGFIKQPELLHPDEDVNRTTASATFSTRGFGEEFFNATASWGRNSKKDHAAEHSALLEGTYAHRRAAFYSRIEWVQKSGEELALEAPDFNAETLYPVNAFTFGMSYDLARIGQTRIALGGQLSLYSSSKALTDLYGDTPLAGQVYLRIFPGVIGRTMGPFFIPQ